MKSAVPVAALLWLVSFPASAVGGYDIAHIVERTCEPGGALIVDDKWRADVGLKTRPGEVIACPPAGPGRSFQLAAARERVGRDVMVCTYFSLFNGDGADLCTDPALSPMQTLMAIEGDRSGPLELAGIVRDDVTTVTLPGMRGEPTLIPIDRQRAARLGATRPFRYFSLTLDRRTLCDEPRLLARDSAGVRVAETAVPDTTTLLSVADRVPHYTSVGALCPSWIPREEVRAVLRALRAWLI